jgi:hypothetical protein
MLALVLAGCGSTAPPSASPPQSVTATTAAPSPMVVPTGTPTSTATSTATSTPSPTGPADGWTVVAARVAYQWRWPGASGAAVEHSTAVPPVPQLVTIGAADHPNDANDRPYNRMSFSFNVGYPSYRFQYVDRLVSDGSRAPVPLAGLGVLRIVFNPAQAHTTDGTGSTILAQPSRPLGLNRMADFAPAGDFEGYLTYGIGIAWSVAESNPQLQVRVYEVTYTSPGQGNRYVIAFDVDAR